MAALEGQQLVQALRQVTLFAALSEESLYSIAPLLKARRYHKDQVIFHQGDLGGCLYLVHAGRIRIYVTSVDGREATVRLYGPGSAFGELSVLDGGPRSASALALDEVTTLILYREDFLQLLRERPDVVEALLTLLAERLRYTTTYSEQRTFLSASGRVAHALLQLAAVYPDPRQPTRIDITQQELAQFAGATREWVNRALRDFAALGMIQVERGAIVVVNRTELQRHVQ